MDAFACKVVFYGTIGFIVGLLLLSLGHLTGILAMVLGIVLIVIGGRNILRESTPPGVPEGTIPNGSSQPADVDEGPHASGAGTTVAVTVLIVLGSLAFLGIKYHLEQLSNPEPAQAPRRAYSPTQPPNPVAEDFLLSITEATDEDYAFYLTLRDHLDAQQYEDVIRHIQSSDKRPRLAAWLLYLGDALNETGQHQQAVDVLSSFLEVQSKTNIYDQYRCPTLYTRARAFVEMEQYEKAIEDLTVVIGEHPASRDALLLREKVSARLSVEGEPEKRAQTVPSGQDARTTCGAGIPTLLALHQVCDGG